MLGPQDVGHRVVVRRIVGVRNNRPIYADALGELIEVTGQDVAVRTSAGLARVPVTEITRARRVPDRRRLTATEALELIAAAGWPAPQVERLGDWLLRAADGWTRRGNSALPVGEPDRPLPAAISAVLDWYRERGLPPAISVPLPLRRRLAVDLDHRGWLADPPVLVQTAPLSALLAGRVRPDGPAVDLAGEPSPAWLTMVAGRKGALPDAARHILSAVPQVRFATVYAGSGAASAVARGVVTADWLGLSLLEVTVAERRRGMAGQVIRALAGWGAAAGASRAYLQVEQRNSTAVGCYQSLGFSTHHTYVTWVAQPGS